VIAEDLGVKLENVKHVTITKDDTTIDIEARVAQIRQQIEDTTSETARSSRSGWPSSPAALP
jgi:chaperonin GroEL